MTINLNTFSRIKSFNMVNMQNKELLALGLEPTIIKLIPLYINLQKEIYYTELIDKILYHKACRLDRDIMEFLKKMRENSQNYNKEETKNILENYYLYKCIKLKPYNSEHELMGYDIEKWLNHNAKIFLNHKCSNETMDAYNRETLELINTLLETKREIYEALYKLFKQTNDYEKTINDLLIIMRHYHPSFIKEELVDDDSFMCLPDVHDKENSGYDKMFLKASQDILVRFIGLDKIESQLPRTITTSKPNIYEEYFNEIIMGWNIV